MVGGPILPLPKGAREAATAGWEKAHPALAFEKYITWPAAWDFPGKEKQAFLRRFVEAFVNHPGKELFKEFTERRKEFRRQLTAQGYCVPEPECLSTQWRFVSGLGIPHPFETGFVFAHTYGVPYLPGSSVKGAARAWAEEMRNDGDHRWGCSLDDDAVLDAVFGPEPSEEGNKKFIPAQGGVIFLDAYPSAWPTLEVDILNPHYKEYYEGKIRTNPTSGKEEPIPPADWLSPVPIYFLTVAPKQTFEFAVAVKTPAAAETLRAALVRDAECLARKALEAIRGAAQNLGLGGKTAVGYGYFE